MTHPKPLSRRRAKPVPYARGKKLMALMVRTLELRLSKLPNIPLAAKPSRVIP